jgi:uncharacterized membrane protein
VTFAYPIPAWALAALLAGAALLAAAAYARTSVPLVPARRAVLSILRFVTLTTIVVFLLRPVVPLGPAGDEGARVAVLVDTSRSMGLIDAGGRTRLAEAVALVRDRLVPELSRTFPVDVLAAGEQVGPATLDRLAPDARHTNLVGALRATRERYRGRDLAGIVVVSDGGETARTTADEEAAASGPPVVTVGVGDPIVRADREVRSVTVGPSAMDASLIDLTATIVSHGIDRPSKVRLLQGTRVLDVRDMRLPPDGTPVQQTFTVAPDRGAAAVYRVEVTGDGRELTAGNNHVDALVTPPSRRRRVLVVEGAPGFEGTFLKRAWQLDPSLEVDSVVRKGATDQGEATYYVQAAASRTSALATGFPSTREALFAYDAVVLANAEVDRIPRDALQLLADFVSERGGGLLVLGARTLRPQGFAGSALEQVLPLALTDRRGGIAQTAALEAGGRLKAALTAEGSRHPLTRLAASEEESRRRWAALPALGGAVSLGAPRPGARVLAVTRAAAGGTVPLIGVQRFGGGRAMMFGGEASWRWRMQMPAADRSYETFWRQAARWLTSEAPDPVSITVPGTLALGLGAPLEIAVRDEAYAPVSGAEVRASVRGPGGTPRELAVSPENPGSGRHRALFAAEEPGPHRLSVEVTRADGGRMATTEQLVLAGGVDPEFVDPRLDETLLRRLAEPTGGGYVRAADAGRVADLLRAGRVPPPQALRDLWHNAWSFVVVIVLLAAEWGLRRRWGLR